MAGAAAMASLFGTNSAGWENSTGSASIGRDDHPHPDLCLVEQLLGKAKGHPHAAVRGRISGQRPAVQRNAVPGDALHVRHPGIVIHGRVVVLVLLEQGEDAGRRLASRDAGRYRRAQDPAVGVVESHLLALDRHDRHDRLAGLARRRRLDGGRGARLFRRGAGGRAPSVRPSPRASQWRESPNAASPRWIAPSSIDLPCHAPVEMRVRACVDQVSDRGFFVLIAAIIHATNSLPIRSWALSARSVDNSLIYDGTRRRKASLKAWLVANAQRRSRVPRSISRRQRYEHAGQFEIRRLWGCSGQLPAFRGAPR